MEKCIDVLRQTFGSDLQEEHVNIEGRGKKGDGFINDIFYMNVTFDGKTIYLVAKIIPDFRKKSMRSVVQNLCQTEVNFYETIWPALDQFQKNITNRKDFDKVPKYIGSYLSEGQGILLLENLKKSNFFLRSKKHLYDKKLVELLFQHLGQFHALTFAFKQKNRDDFNKLATLLTFNWNDFIRWDVIEETLAGLSKKLPTLCKEIGTREKIEIFSKKMMHDLNDVTLYKGSHETLIHGDCWINNFLFQTNESGQIKDLRCLDFQLAQMGTPVYDLSFCFYTGATKDLLLELDHFLQVYHTSLSKKLDDFGFDVQTLYPFDVLKQEWKQYSKFGFIMSLMVWRGKTSDNVKDLKDADSAEKHVEHDNCDEETYARVIGDLIDHMYENKLI